MDVDVELVEVERCRRRRCLALREEWESDEVDVCLRRRCLFRRRCASERAFLGARFPRGDVEDEEDDELCLLLRARFLRGDFDLEREVETCFVLAGRLPRGDLDLKGDVEVDGAGDPSPQVDGL